MTVSRLARRAVFRGGFCVILFKARKFGFLCRGVVLRRKPFARDIVNLGGFGGLGACGFVLNGGCVCLLGVLRSLNFRR